MKIGFVADLFREQYLGGGECNDETLIKYLIQRGHSVEKIRCADFDEEKINSHDVFIVGNFIGLQEKYKITLQAKKYIIYEHDHKYLTTRDPSRFKDFLAPTNAIINRDFYKNAHAVVVLSQICKDVIEKNLDISNIHNIGCSLWTNDKFKLIESLIPDEKNKNYALLKSTNPVKGFQPAYAYCQKNNIEIDVIEPCFEKELLTRLSQYKVFVFFPQVLETFCRLAAEAKMLKCKLLTTPNMLGFYSEECYKLEGVELLQDLRSRRDNAFELFERLIK
jgi:hypothetical protein